MPERVNGHRAPRRANVIDGRQGRARPLRSHVGFGGRTRQRGVVWRATLSGHKVDALLQLVGLGHGVEKLLVGRVMIIEIALLEIGFRFFQLLVQDHILLENPIVLLLPHEVVQRAMLLGS